MGERKVSADNRAEGVAGVETSLEVREPLGAASGAVILEMPSREFRSRSDEQQQHDSHSSLSLTHFVSRPA